MKPNPISLLLFVLGMHTLALAQKSPQPSRLLPKKSIPLMYAQQDVVHSSILKEDRKINIYLPQDFHETTTEHRYPVLLLLENEFFQMVSGVVKHLSAVERMPETIVVSLVDGPVVPKLYTNGSDFWPKDWKQLPFGENPDAFTKHLSEELFPYLKDNFRANEFKMVMGLSATSVYALHAFAQEPELFDAHIAIAAGDVLGMGYVEGESMIDVIVTDFKNNPDRKGWLYVTSADSDGYGQSPMIAANLEELESRLAPYRSEDFRFISKIFPDEGHYDVALPALEDALELLFPKENWFANYRELIKAPGNPMENLDAYFGKLSAEYGFEVFPKAERWNSGNSLSSIGSHLSRQGQTSEAIEVIARWVRYRPKSTVALRALAKAYEANNELNKAISIVERAHKMSLELEEDYDYQTQLRQLREKLAKERN